MRAGKKEKNDLHFTENASYLQSTSLRNAFTSGLTCILFGPRLAKF